MDTDKHPSQPIHAPADLGTSSNRFINLIVEQVLRLLKGEIAREKRSGNWGSSGSGDTPRPTPGNISNSPVTFVDWPVLTTIISGERLSVLMSKISTAIKALILHLLDFNNPHKVNAYQIGDIDCGFFVEDDEVAVHNVTSTEHQYITVDGNINIPDVSGDTTLTQHRNNLNAHPDIIVDGNAIADIGEEGVPLSEHMLDRESHKNLVVDGNMAVVP